jgi:SAM-dependent methyltransferase
MIKSIENRWDILYQNYPEVYEEFAAVPKTPGINLVKMFDLEGKTIADVGSGTGASSFRYSSYAKEVIGIEITQSMINIAKGIAKEKGIENVRFIVGDARSLLLKSNQVDAVIGLTLAVYPPEVWAFIYGEIVEGCHKPASPLLPRRILYNEKAGALCVLIPKKRLPEFKFLRFGSS